MSQTIARIILAMTLLAATPIVYIVLFSTIERHLLPADREALRASGALTALLFGVAWILLWRQQITWTRNRRLATALSPFWCIGVAIILALIIELFAFRRRGSEETALLVCAIWLPVWLASTALIWRESDAERVARDHGPSGANILCPQCGYDMTGLYEARCPECGTQYTLDQLLALARSDDDQIDER